MHSVPVVKYCIAFSHSFRALSNSSSRNYVTRLVHRDRLEQKQQPQAAQWPSAAHQAESYRGKTPYAPLVRSIKFGNAKERGEEEGYTHSAVTRLVNLRRDACSNECGCWATLCGCHRKREKEGEKKKSALCNCHSAIVLNDSLDHCSCLSCTTAVVVYESYPRETAKTGKTVFSSNSTSSQPDNQPTTATMYKEHLLRQWAKKKMSSENEHE